jgi:hypothetical protein
MPHDAEVGRFGDSLERITAMCFAPGPPELLLVARGKNLTEWREKKKEDKQDREEEVPEEDEESLLLPKARTSRDEFTQLRKLAPDAEINSCAALNGLQRRTEDYAFSLLFFFLVSGHHFPLWALGCADGNVRVWGRGEDGIVASWMCEEQTSCLSFDSMNSLLHVGTASSVQMWDCLSEQNVRSFSSLQNITALHALPASSLAAAG